jgi:hypothetical protein
LTPVLSRRVAIIAVPLEHRPDVGEWVRCEWRRRDDFCLNLAWWFRWRYFLRFEAGDESGNVVEYRGMDGGGDDYF